MSDKTAGTEYVQGGNIVTPGESGSVFTRPVFGRLYAMILLCSGFNSWHASFAAITDKHASAADVWLSSFTLGFASLLMLMALTLFISPRRGSRVIRRVLFGIRAGYRHLKTGLYNLFH